MIPRGGGGDRGGDVGRRLRGEEERKGEEGADVWARFARERGGLARGAALSEGERGRARLAGPASCAARAWAGWATLARWAAGKKKERGGRNGPAGKKKEAGWAELGWCGSEREESGWAARRKETGLAGFGFWAGFLFFSISKSIQTKFI